MRICITRLLHIFKSCLGRTPGVGDMPSVKVSLLKGSLPIFIRSDYILLPHRKKDAVGWLKTKTSMALREHLPA